MNKQEFTQKYSPFGKNFKTDLDSVIKTETAKVILEKNKVLIERNKEIFKANQQNEKLKKLVEVQEEFMDLYSDYPDEGCDCLKCKGARELRAEIAKLKTELE